MLRNNPGALRAHVFARDGGRCADCGFEAELARVALVATMRTIHPDSWRAYLDDRGFAWLRVKLKPWAVRGSYAVFNPHYGIEAVAERTLGEIRFRNLRAEYPPTHTVRGPWWNSDQCLGHTWEADHDKALVDGGSHDPSRVVTRCVPCHRAKTKREASARAARRRKGGA